LNLDTPITTTSYIQLLQLASYTHTEVIQCKVEIMRTIYHCGMHSHIAAVHNGYASYLREISRSRCVQMHKEGLLRIGESNIIDELKPNNTYYRSVTIAEKIMVDGTCKGVQYSDYYDTWDDVIVQATVKISLKTAFVSVKLNAGKIILKSGTTCNLSEETCVDSDDGYTFWQSIPMTACEFEAYNVLFEGTATKFQGLLGTQHYYIHFRNARHDF